MVVIESGVPDSAADISIPPQVGPDAAFDLSPSEPLAAPDAPSDPSPGVEKGNADAATLDMACAAGYQYGGNGNCVAIGSEGADSGSDCDGTGGQDDTATGQGDGAVDAEPADAASPDSLQTPDRPDDLPANGGTDGATGGTGETSGGNPPLAPTDLNVADRAAPLNVEGTPLFGWVPNDPDGNEIQSAYEIQVARVSDGLVTWDSGKVPSSAESFVAYAGSALAAGTSYTWTVRTWDRTDQVSGTLRKLRTPTRWDLVWRPRRVRLKLPLTWPDSACNKVR
jgi:hypothetical protein